LRLTHERYPEEWVRDGRPLCMMLLAWRGYRRWPPGCTSLLTWGKFVVTAVTLRWLFRTPVWVRQDERARWLRGSSALPTPSDCAGR
jgi:hypothetical protein